jgi:hypothetical protein
LEAWEDLEPEDPAVPDFATKISLSRLLMEADMNTDAWRVLNRLIQEDDQSVEAWYLGGWCQYLIAEDYGNGKGVKSATVQTGTGGATMSTEEQAERLANAAFKGSRRWLQSAQKLYDMQDYEDDRLLAHVKELVASLDQKLGPVEGDDTNDDEDDWEGIADDEDGDDDGSDDDDGDARMADS